MAGSIIELHTEVPADQEANVFGQFDEHLKLIERTLNVTVISRFCEKTYRRTGSSGETGQYHHEAECKLCSFPCHGTTK